MIYTLFDWMLAFEFSFASLDNSAVQINGSSTLITFQIQNLMIGDNALVYYLDIIMDQISHGGHTPAWLIHLCAHRPCRPQDQSQQHKNYPDMCSFGHSYYRFIVYPPALRASPLKGGMVLRPNQHSSFSIQHSSFSIQHSSFSIQHSAFYISSRMSAISLLAMFSATCGVRASA